MGLKVIKGVTGYIVCENTYGGSACGTVWGCSTLREVEIVLKQYFESTPKAED